MHIDGVLIIIVNCLSTVGRHGIPRLLIVFEQMSEHLAFVDRVGGHCVSVRLVNSCLLHPHAAVAGQSELVDRIADNDVSNSLINGVSRFLLFVGPEFVAVDTPSILDNVGPIEELGHTGFRVVFTVGGIDKLSVGAHDVGFRVDFGDFGFGVVDDVRSHEFPLPVRFGEFHILIEVCQVGVGVVGAMVAHKLSPILISEHHIGAELGKSRHSVVLPLLTQQHIGVRVGEFHVVEAMHEFGVGVVVTFVAFQNIPFCIDRPNVVVAVGEFCIGVVISPVAEELVLILVHNPHIVPRLHEMLVGVVFSVVGIHHVSVLGGQYHVILQYGYMRVGVVLPHVAGDGVLQIPQLGILSEDSQVRERVVFSIIGIEHLVFLIDGSTLIIFGFSLESGIFEFFGFQPSVAVVEPHLSSCLRHPGVAIIVEGIAKELKSVALQQHHPSKGIERVVVFIVSCAVAIEQCSLMSQFHVAHQHVCPWVVGSLEEHVGMEYFDF